MTLSVETEPDPGRSVVVLSVTAIVSAASATSVDNDAGSGDDGKGNRAVSMASVLHSNPTPSPTGAAAPLNCTMENLGPILEEIYDYYTWGEGGTGTQS